MNLQDLEQVKEYSQELFAKFKQKYCIRNGKLVIYNKNSDEWISINSTERDFFDYFDSIYKKNLTYDNCYDHLCDIEEEEEKIKENPNDGFAKEKLTELLKKYQSEIQHLELKSDKNEIHIFMDDLTEKSFKTIVDKLSSTPDVLAKAIYSITINFGTLEKLKEDMEKQQQELINK